MENDFFKELEKDSLKSKKKVTRKEYNNIDDEYIDAVILSVLLPVYGLLIYCINIGNNKYLARKCLKASLISIGICILIFIIIIAGGGF